MKNILTLILVFVIGLNFNAITSTIKKEIKQANKIQYCNDIYMGNSYQINACIDR